MDQDGSGMAIGTLGDLKTDGKTVLLRLDLNSPIDPTSNIILDDKRFREHVPTIQALKNSRIVILTHQSRPGKKDFTTLEAHAESFPTLSESRSGILMTYLAARHGSQSATFATGRSSCLRT